MSVSSPSSSILMIAVGSRGDHEPLLALASYLKSACSTSNSDLQIHLALSPDYVTAAPSHPNLHVHPIQNYSLRAFRNAMSLHYKPPTDMNDKDGKELENQVAAMGALTEHCVAPSLQELFKLTEIIKPDVILCTTLALLVSKCLADYYGIQCLSLHMQPNSPTSYYPCYLYSKNMSVQSADILSMNESYKENDKLDSFYTSYQSLLTFYKYSMDKINETRRSLLNLKNSNECLDDMTQMLKGECQNVTIIHSYLNLLHARAKAPDISDKSIHIVSPLAHIYIPTNFDPSTSCPKTLNVVNSSKRLICVSVGSMRVSTELCNEISESIFKSINEFDASCNVITFSGNQLMSSSYENVYEFPLENVQYAWLFDKCDMIICHGGAGVVAAAAAAGKPSVVAAIMGDQWMWAAIVKRFGIGSAIERGLHGLRKEDLDSALSLADDMECRKRCKEYKQNLRDGGNEGCRDVSKMIFQCLDKNALEK